MKIKLITVGSPQLSFAKDGIAEYLKRLSRFVQVSVVHVKENKKDTDVRILKTIDNDFCILLDEQGREFSSSGLSDFLIKKQNQGVNLSFVIGGPDGHTDMIRQRADFLISLSQLTFPHDIAMMIVLEALYRSYTIQSGHPYHRA